MNKIVKIREMEKQIIQLGRRTTFLMFLMLIILTSCNDEKFLEEKPLSFFSPENVYSSVAGIRQGITALYVEFRLDYGYRDKNTGTTLWLGMTTDIAFYGEDPGSTKLLTNYQTWLLPANSTVRGYWNNWYRMIQYANVVIEASENLDVNEWDSPAQQQAYIAEGRFWRAFCYRNLVPFYGDCPLVTSAVKTAKVDFTRDPKADIYEQMEEDLLFAAENLPKPGEEEDPGRVTQGVAWHYLAETYLAEGKYQQAADAASEVIDGGHYALMTQRFGSTVDVFGTGDVYLDLFAYGNQNLPENREAMWVLQIEPNVTGGLEFAGERMYGPAYFRMGNTPDGKKAFIGEFVDGKYTGYSDTLGRPVAWMRPTYYVTHRIWKSDWSNDIRNAKHNIKRDFYFDNPQSAYYGQKVDFSLYPPGKRNAILDTCQYIFPFFMKFADPCHHFTAPAESGGGRNHKDIYQLRVAETYLLRAEAYIGLNRKDLAAADINAVRNRAHATPVTGAQVDINYLLDERARELYGEEQRSFVLLRNGVFLQRTRQYNDNPLYPGSNVQDYNTLWPIPQDFIDLNIGATIGQNPGY